MTQLKGAQVTWLEADGWLPSADRLNFFEHLANGIKTLKEQGKKEKGNLEIITLTFPFHAESHK